MIEQATTSRRMTGDERREQILHAALGAFAAGGYAGTSTDQVARAAGVSQPYVVRLFGSKQELFAQVYAYASQQIEDAFRDIPPGPDAKRQMGDAYVRLLADRDLLLVLMHGFTVGADPEVGQIARRTLASAFRMHRERTGATPEEAREFVAYGMLINVLIASGVGDHLGEDPDLDELAACTFGDELSAITSPPQPSPHGAP